MKETCYVCGKKTLKCYNMFHAHKYICFKCAKTATHGNNGRRDVNWGGASVELVELLMRDPNISLKEAEIKCPPLFKPYDNGPIQKQKKDASVIGSAVVGGVVAGPAGAVVGAIHAANKNNKKK